MCILRKDSGRSAIDNSRRSKKRGDLLWLHIYMHENRKQKLVVPVMADEMQKKELGRTNEFLVNGAPLALLNTKTAVAADYLLFWKELSKPS